MLLALLASVPDERVERLRRIHARHAGVPLVATMPEDTPNGVLRRVLQAGADGIVTEESLERSLVPSVQAVAAGQLAVPAKLRRQIAPRHLTYREKQIMGLVVIGYTNRQIADELFLAESTVKTHLSSAFAKLEARSRAEAAALVLDPDEGYRLRWRRSSPTSSRRWRDRPRRGRSSRRTPLIGCGTERAGESKL